MSCLAKGEFDCSLFAIAIAIATAVYIQWTKT